MSSCARLAFLGAIAGVLVRLHQSAAISSGEHPTLPTHLSQLSNGELRVAPMLQNSDFTQCAKISFALQSKNSGKFLQVAKKATVLNARGRSWRPKRGTVLREFPQISGFGLQTSDLLIDHDAGFQINLVTAYLSCALSRSEGTRRSEDNEKEKATEIPPPPPKKKLHPVAGRFAHLWIPFLMFRTLNSCRRKLVCAKITPNVGKNLSWCALLPNFKKNQKRKLISSQIALVHFSHLRGQLWGVTTPQIHSFLSIF